jgi:hypothetical protein
MRMKCVSANPGWIFSFKVGEVYSGSISHDGSYFSLDGADDYYPVGYFEEVKDEKPEDCYQKPNKYSVQINGESTDVYDVLKAFNVVNPALQHLIKKALKVGNRGHKDADTDYQDIIDSAIRAKELG